ncbi:hypothetical protein PV327_010223 [Microctonus hyperodae]|uniref:Tetraspanin n=1 Tax=Microctonus hyperodae TaxID=165561 RepID=A0AA39FRU6_MICHY|nr:hypothetical protein PV327_010223 [Microctonus hyperodae]
MNYAVITIKYLLFVFNLVFSLCGTAVYICGVLMYVNMKQSSSEVQDTYSLLAVGIIITGGITFIIAFFGCFGAIRKNRCMIITFGIFILIILVVQNALYIYFIIVLNEVNGTVIVLEYKEIFDKYWEHNHCQIFVDSIQVGMKCCGVDGPDDYKMMSNATEKYPWSCCPLKNDLKFESCESSEIHDQGCRNYLVDILMSGGKLLDGIIFGMVAIEWIGIIIAIFLAQTMRNDDR